MGRRHAAVLDEVRVRDGHVVDAASKEPFDLLFSPPKFEYGDVVGREGFEPSKAKPADLQSRRRGVDQCRLSAKRCSELGLLGAGYPIHGGP